MKRILWCCLFFLAVAVGNAQPEAILNQANEAYRKNAFGDAVKGYEDLLAAGYDNAKVHYNLGNAYYRMEKLGPAILHFEKASLMTPGDEDIQHNLEVARKQLTDKLEVVPEFFLTRWWRDTTISLTAAGWSTMALLFLWGGVGGIIIWLLAKERRYKKLGFILGIILLLLSIFPFTLASARAAMAEESGFAIVLVPEADLVSGPESTTSLLKIHEGLKVKLLDRIGDWEKVGLHNGEQGWLPKEVLGKI
ncbi:MAG: hypothetical protein DHS20C18_30890 [Saprospiraceae bacterium]|nr:MAG: hypothetical protein DHS20C18_30890 [Saprospiraceae bacterium]